MLGIIVHANEDHDAADYWALVSHGTVQNTTVGSYNDIVANYQGDYDYLIDITVSQQVFQMDDLYDPELDQFSTPPIDYIAQLQANVDQIVDDIAIALDNSNGMSPEDIQAALDESFADEGDGFTENEQALYDAISAYILGGG